MKVPSLPAPSWPVSQWKAMMLALRLSALYTRAKKRQALFFLFPSCFLLACFLTDWSNLEGVSLAGTPNPQTHRPVGCVHNPDVSAAQLCRSCSCACLPIVQLRQLLNHANSSVAPIIRLRQSLDYANHSVAPRAWRTLNCSQLHHLIRSSSFQLAPISLDSKARTGIGSPSSSGRALLSHVYPTTHHISYSPGIPPRTTYISTHHTQSTSHLASTTLYDITSTRHTTPTPHQHTNTPTHDHATSPRHHNITTPFLHHHNATTTRHHTYA